MKKVLISISAILVFCIALSGWTAPAVSAGIQTYIVVFEDYQDPEDMLRGLGEKYRFEVTGIYQHALRGAVIKTTSHQAEAIGHDARVRLIEPNQVFEITDEPQVIPTGISRVFADDNGNIGINVTDDFRVDADVAVLDTGIDFDHPDLNLAMAIDCTWSGPNEGTCAGTRDDGHGHGTHVAGTIGALDNNEGVVGVAPGVRLWAVKVLTNYGTGTTAQILAGIDWVAAHADEIEVANMSLGGVGESGAMDGAIAGATGAGVLFTLSAGNRTMDVDNYHPAGQPDAITVSALTDYDGEPGGIGVPTCRDYPDDTLAAFSNFGAGVDIAAPGVCIYSTYMEGGYATMSGTSMAAPHVAGAAAILASRGITDPTVIKSTLIAEENVNYDWVDISDDGIQEPLLDLSNAGVFAPRMIDVESQLWLTADGFTQRGWQFTNLDWLVTDTDIVDIYRDGEYIDTWGGGSYLDEVGIKGKGMHFYRVCESPAQLLCSDTVIVTY